MKRNTVFAGRRGFLSAVLSTSLMVGAGLVPGLAIAQAPGGQDAKAQADVTHQLDNKRLRGVSAKVQDGVVTLTGSVQTFLDKQDAGKKVAKLQKVGEITRVDNQIQVQGADVSDQVLAQKLANKLAINNLVPERTAFGIVNPSVQNGVVTLSGLVTQPVDKDDVEGIVASTPGVKDMVDKLQVAPVSPNDDRIRRDMFRAIYGYQTFTKYALNPAKSIRILVVNGNVTLVGVVDSQGDKEMAGIRANGVGGAFKVTNDLQVQGQQNEHGN
jgi:hyperosmotically inducible protein